MPTLYQWDEQKIYVPSANSPARENPEEPGKYLLTGTGTLETPPALNSGEVAVWRNGYWEKKTDIRGTYWNKQTKEPVSVTSIDANISGLINIQPSDISSTWNEETQQWDIDLTKAKLKKTHEVQTKTTQLIASGFVYSDTTFSCEDTAQMNWTSLILVADSISYPFHIGDMYGNPVSFANKNEILSCYALGLNFKNPIMQGEFNLRKQINDATTYSQVSGIVDDRK